MTTDDLYALDVQLTQASGAALGMHTASGYNHISIFRIH